MGEGGSPTSPAGNQVDSKQYEMTPFRSLTKKDFESGFRKTVQWYLENQDWWQRILNGEYKLERLGLA